MRSPSLSVGLRWAPTLFLTPPRVASKRKLPYLPATSPVALGSRDACLSSKRKLDASSDIVVHEVRGVGRVVVPFLAAVAVDACPDQVGNPGSTRGVGAPDVAGRIICRYQAATGTNQAVLSSSVVLPLDEGGSERIKNCTTPHDMRPD